MKKNIFNKVSLVFIRLLGTIPIFILVNISCFSIMFKMMLNYFKYGSELIIRNDTFTKSDIRTILNKLQESENEVLFKYYAEVCELAEDKMFKSGESEGMYYHLAMEEILKKYQNDVKK